MNESMCIHKTEKWILKLSLALVLSCSSTFCRLYFATYVESRYLDKIHFKSSLFWNRITFCIKLDIFFKYHCRVVGGSITCCVGYRLDITKKECIREWYLWYFFVDKLQQCFSSDVHFLNMFYLFIYLKIACAVGFKGNNCGTKCTFPTYGQDCQMICSCGKKDCDFVTGCRRSLKGI